MDRPVGSVVPELDKERSGNTSKKFTVFLKSLEAGFYSALFAEFNLKESILFHFLF